MKTHKWKNIGAKQYSSLGLPPSSAESYYFCENCGVNIGVAYNSGEGIGEGMKRAGVSEECPKGAETNTEGGKKIFCFINSSSNFGVDVVAICEDGHALGGHFSSNESWAKHDIGLTSDRKHDKYKEHCPEGFQLIWVEDPKNHKELGEAYKLNQELKKSEKE